MQACPGLKNVIQNPKEMSSLHESDNTNFAGGYFYKAVEASVEL
jgi:hypothetical protein